ncbi:hypothetical protein EJ08DRAFT_631024 [Tothia fuscella]|uniref:Uncharacterized protein n=1 Tax=Tothia fuscella TaxID=1048955 RepID=A0A9P4NVR6_9PEZI|nr:hypothetical protein EJ08DRAFT_631024 [Tothia fuscella]
MGAAVPNNPEPVPDADAVAAPDAAPAPVIDINLLAALEIQDEEAAADVLWLEFERNLGRGGANPAFQPRPAGQPRNRNRLPALEGGPANFRPEPYGLGAQRRFHGGGGGQVRRDDVDAFRYEDVGTDTEEENRVEPDEQVEGGGEDHLLDGNELPPREVDVSFVPARRGPGRGRGRRRGRNAGGPPVVDPSQVNGIDVGQAVDAGRAVDTVIEEQ